MKKIVLVTVCIATLATTFLAGYWYSKGQVTGSESGGKRTILYYVDPMNPQQKYDKPGIAPCGMALEPVYEDGGNSSRSAAMPPGTVMITPEKQQLIGVRTEQVENKPSSYTIRLLGKIAADETRIYRVNSSVAGWIRKVGPLSTGSLVTKGEVLATFYAPEFLAAEQSYLNALSSSNLRSIVRSPGIQASVAEQSLQQTENNLRFLGMGERQIRTLDRTREFSKSVDIEAPANGFIVSRNISFDQKFDKGFEFYSIADLGKVWVLLDTYGTDATHFRPGEKVPVRWQGNIFEATVDDVQPQFDPATRTLRVRLVADNPDFVLRPDMFVQVEYPATLPPALTVPVDAVLDSGMRKTIFVDRGDGFFEPRRIETGRYFSDRVEITRGLMPGERIVVSGNFLIDSESRFKSPEIETTGMTGVDPICGMMVSEELAGKAGLTSVYQGKKYVFCSLECKERFDKAPQDHVKAPAPEMQAGDHDQADPAHEHAHDHEQMTPPGPENSAATHGEMVMPSNTAGEPPNQTMEGAGKMPETVPAEKSQGAVNGKNEEDGQHADSSGHGGEGQ